MNTNREICIAEGLLLCTWFLLDVVTLNPIGKNILTVVTLNTFMIFTAGYILSFWIRKNKSFISLAKTLWKSNYFDAMVSVSIALPWMGYAFGSETLNTFIIYICWALAAISLLLGLLSKRDLSLPSEDVQCK